MGGCGHEWRSVSVSVCLCDKLYQNTDGLRLCASVFWKGGGRGGSKGIVLHC